MLTFLQPYTSTLSTLLNILIMLFLCNGIFPTIKAAFIQGTTPLQAKPPNHFHFDKRYGISNGPGQELFTGDVVVITIEEISPADGSLVFNTLAQGDNGDILCLDPTIPTSLQYTTQYANQFSNYQNTAFAQAYQGTGQEAPIFGKGAYGSAYSSSSYLPDWSPSLVNMFTVHVVDGRLGIFNLAPIIAFPNSPKYITPQPTSPRSGVGSSIDRTAWETQLPQNLAVNTLLQPLDSFYAFPSANYPIFPPHLVTVPTTSPGYGSPGYQSGTTTIAVPDEYDQNSLNKIFIRGSSKHGFCTCSAGKVRCPFNGSLGGKIIYPNLSNLDPTFSRFTITKVPYPVVRRLLENYRAILQHGTPSQFMLLSSFPLIDRVDGLHFHGAEAQLSSRRLYIGQLRVTARGTRLEQQAIMVLRNLVSDTIRFTFNWGLTLIPQLSLGNSLGAFIPGLPVTFGRNDEKKHKQVSDEQLQNQFHNTSNAQQVDPVGHSDLHQSDGNGRSRRFLSENPRSEILLGLPSLSSSFQLNTDYDTTTHRTRQGLIDKRDDSNNDQAESTLSSIFSTFSTLSSSLLSPPDRTTGTSHQRNLHDATSNNFQPSPHNIAPIGEQISLLNSNQPYHQSLLKQHLKSDNESPTSAQSRPFKSHSPTSPPSSSIPYSPYIQHYSEIEYNTQSIQNQQRKGAKTKQYTNMFTPGSTGQTQFGNQHLKVVTNIFQFDSPDSTSSDDNHHNHHHTGSNDNKSDQDRTLLRAKSHSQNNASNKPTKVESQRIGSDSDETRKNQQLTPELTRQRIMELLKFDEDEIAVNSEQNNQNLKNGSQLNIGRNKMTSQQRKQLINQIFQEIAPIQTDNGTDLTESSLNTNPTTSPTTTSPHHHKQQLQDQFPGTDQLQQRFPQSEQEVQYDWFHDRTSEYKHLYRLLDIPFATSSDNIKVEGESANNPKQIPKGHYASKTTTTTHESAKPTKITSIQPPISLSPTFSTSNVEFHFPIAHDTHHGLAQLQDYQSDQLSLFPRFDPVSSQSPPQTPPISNQSTQKPHTALPHPLLSNFISFFSTLFQKTQLEYSNGDYRSNPKLEQNRVISRDNLGINLKHLALHLYHLFNIGPSFSTSIDPTSRTISEYQHITDLTHHLLRSLQDQCQDSTSSRKLSALRKASACSTLHLLEFENNPASSTSTPPNSSHSSTPPTVPFTLLYFAWENECEGYYQTDIIHFHSCLDMADLNLSRSARDKDHDHSHGNDHTDPSNPSSSSHSFSSSSPNSDSATLQHHKCVVEQQSQLIEAFAAVDTFLSQFQAISADLPFNQLVVTILTRFYDAQYDQSSQQQQHQQQQRAPNSLSPNHPKFTPQPKSLRYHFATILSYLVHHEQAQSDSFRLNLMTTLDSYSSANTAPDSTNKSYRLQLDSLGGDFGETIPTSQTTTKYTFQERFTGQHGMKLVSDEDYHESHNLTHNHNARGQQHSRSDSNQAGSHNIFSTLSALFSSNLPTTAQSQSNLDSRIDGIGKQDQQQERRQPKTSFNKIAPVNGLGDTSDMIDLRSAFTHQASAPKSNTNSHQHQSQHRRYINNNNNAPHFSHFDTFSMPNSYNQNDNSHDNHQDSNSQHQRQSLNKQIQQINVLDYLGESVEKKPTGRSLYDATPSTPVQLPQQYMHTHHQEQPKHRQQNHGQKPTKAEYRSNHYDDTQSKPISNTNTTSPVASPTFSSTLLPNLMSLSPSYPFSIRSPPHSTNALHPNNGKGNQDPLSSGQSSAKFNFPSLGQYFQSQHDQSHDSSHPTNNHSVNNNGRPGNNPQPFSTTQQNQFQTSHASPSSLSPFDNLHTMSTMQAVIPGLLDSILFSFQITIALGVDVDFGTVLELAGECALISPPSSSSIGHAVQHIGFTTVPFSLDLVRPEWFWNGQWIADWHLASRPVDVMPIIRAAVVTFGNSDENAFTDEHDHGNSNQMLQQATFPNMGVCLSKEQNEQQSARNNQYLGYSRQCTFASLINPSSFIGTTPRPHHPLLSNNSTSSQNPLNQHNSVTHAGKFTTLQSSGSAEVNTTPTLRPGPFSDVVNAVSAVSNANTIPVTSIDSECIDPFTYDNTADRFTIQRASVENNIYSLTNPLGLIHPAMEQHHFALSGTYTATNTMFLEYVVERVG